jgi:hypothetical protein
MLPTHRCLLALLLLSAPLPAAAADFVTKVVDGLGRPVANVVVDVYWSGPENDFREVSLLHLVSNDHGIVKGTYDETTVPPDQTIMVELSKEGYSGYSSTDLMPEYVLRRELGPADVQRIAALAEKAQIDELRELLAADFEDSGEWIDGLVFVQEHRFRTALRALVTDAKVGTAAAQLLAFIGVPEDVRLVVEHAPPPEPDSFEDRWVYGVVSSLLEPTTEKEWAFLRSAALNENDDPWLVFGAITTLKLIASPKSLQILKEAGKIDRDVAEAAEQAIQYIESGPPSLSDEDLVAAGKKAAQAIRFGDWKGNKPPRFNETGDKALVECEFVAGRDLLVHTATFHKVEGRWKLRGVRETMQALLAKKTEG